MNSMDFNTRLVDNTRVAAQPLQPPLNRPKEIL